MVTPFFLGLAGVYLCLKYGVLTAGARQVVHAAGPVTPVVLVCVALAWLGDNPYYDVFVLVLAAAPLLAPHTISTLVSTYAAVVASVRFAVLGLGPLVPLAAAAAAISVSGKVVGVLYSHQKRL